MIRTLLIMTILLGISTGGHGEPVLLKSIERVPIIAIPGGIGEVVKETDHMPGNNELGFFSKPIGGELYWCRIRLKVSCDYGLGGLMNLKLRDFSLEIEKFAYKSRTDDQGITDLIFRCQRSDQYKTVKLVIGKHIETFIMKECPKELLITDNECK